MKTDMPKAIRLADYQPPAFFVDHVDLTIRLDGPATRATGLYRMRSNPSQSVRSDTLVLDADAMPPVVAHIDGKPVDVVQDDCSVRIVAPTNESFQLKLSVTLDPAANTALSGLYLTRGVYCTQCEAQGFRRILPFLDRPDVLATYRVTLDARQDTCPVLLSNGNPLGTQTLHDGWHQAVWDDPHPKPSYLFALVGGRLDRVTDTFTTEGGQDIKLAIYVEPGKADQAGFAMEALKRSMRWDETRFGRLYDLDVFNIVAVSDFNLGAMENKGLNIFNDKYILASPETATDEDYERIEAIIAHEYFHNWSGNRVTCRDWFQLCLKEGLTVFRDQEYTSDLYDRTIKRIQDVRGLWAHQFPEDGGPLAHPVRPDSYREINNFYTATVYEKGAEIVRMIATWMGETRFRAGMDRYFSSYDGQAVRMEEFLASMEAAATDLGPWPDFMRWYTQAGTPRVKVAINHLPSKVGTSQDEASTGEAAHAGIRFDFQQMTKPTPGEDEKHALPIPCTLGLVGSDGVDAAFDETQVEATGGRWLHGRYLLEEPHGSLTITGLSKSNLKPSLFRDFSAPVTIETEGLNPEDRLELAAKDPNSFNSWSHFQTLYSDALQRRYTRAGLGEPLGTDEALIDAMMARALAQPLTPGDSAGRAAAITLPSAHDVARTIGTEVDPDRIHLARQSFSQDVCVRYADQVQEVLDLIDLGDSAIGPEPAAGRAYAAALLTHLAASNEASMDDLLFKLFSAAAGMTMRIKTLALLVRRGSDHATEALDIFERRFADQPLAMDKWFMAQATSADAATIEKLERHTSYDASNPNRVRSLVGVFVSANLTGFHAPDGSGYRLLAERVAALDAINPQLAARLCVAFRSWRSMEPARRARAEHEMRNLATKSDLSPDTSDILSRTLT